MAKILIPFEQSGDWYEELAVVSNYGETEYEEKIKQYSEAIFTEYHTIRFKKEVTLGGKAKKPDLALIAKDFSSWWIVEVELTGHSVDHVLEQVEVFSQGDYNLSTLYKYIRNVFEEELPDVILEESVVEALIKGVNPRVLVIVDAPTEQWRTALKGKNTALCDLQIFKNTQRSEAYKLGGDYPSIFVDSVHLIFPKSPRNTLELINASGLTHPLTNETEIVLNYRGKNSEWSVDVVNDRTYIKCLGKLCPLHSGNEYVLKTDTKGKYTILDS